MHLFDNIFFYKFGQKLDKIDRIKLKLLTICNGVEFTLTLVNLYELIITLVCCFICICLGIEMKNEQ
jgi:hypothetical protein